MLRNGEEIEEESANKAKMKEKLYMWNSLRSLLRWYISRGKKYRGGKPRKKKVSRNAT